MATKKDAKVENVKKAVEKKVVEPVVEAAKKVTEPVKKAAEPVVKAAEPVVAPVKKAAKKTVEASKKVATEAAKKVSAEVKKTAAKAAKATVVLQFAGKEIKTDDILAAAKKAYAQNNKAAIKDITLYVKPEDNAAYYVVNGDVTGKVEL